MSDEQMNCPTCGVARYLGRHGVNCEDSAPIAPSSQPLMGDRARHADVLRTLLQSGGETWLSSEQEGALQAALALFAHPVPEQDGWRGPKPDRIYTDRHGDEWRLTLIYDRLEDYEAAHRASRPEQEAV